MTMPCDFTAKFSIESACLKPDAKQANNDPVTVKHYNDYKGKDQS